MPPRTDRPLRCDCWLSRRLPHKVCAAPGQVLVSAGARDARPPPRPVPAAAPERCQRCSADSRVRARCIGRPLAAGRPAISACGCVLSVLQGHQPHDHRLACVSSSGGCDCLIAVQAARGPLVLGLPSMMCPACVSTDSYSGCTARAAWQQQEHANHRIVGVSPRHDS